jgi:hypothetical protein
MRWQRSEALAALVPEENDDQRDGPDGPRCMLSQHEGGRGVNGANRPGKWDERRWATGPKGRLGRCQFGRKREIGWAGKGFRDEIK